MSLSSDLVRQFVQITNDDNKTKSEVTLYGTVVIDGDSEYVRIDGSEVLTPVSTTADIKNGDRVTVLIKNHSAIITGNVSSRSASSDDLQETNKKVSEFEIVIADKVSVGELDAQIGRIDKLVSDNVTIKERLTANEAIIGDLEADNVVINGKLTANEAEIETLKTSKLDAATAEITYATIENLDAANANITNLKAEYGSFKELTTDKFEANEAEIETLKTEKLSASEADLKYAAITELDAAEADIEKLKVDKADITDLDVATAKIEDLEAGKIETDKLIAKKADIDLANVNNAWIQNGIIKDGSIGEAAIGEGAITNAKIADATIESAKIKSINADSITAGTLKTDRLIITGPDGQDSIVKAINIVNGVSEAEVNGQKIQAASIDVIDLSAFEATLAQFQVSGNAIYSGKESINDPNSGIYISTSGIGMGDGSLTGKDESPLQAYADGSFKLTGKNSSFDFNTVTGELNIEASSLKISSKSVATTADVDELRDEITTLLRIESSRGTVFKNDQVATVLSVVIYHGKQRITDTITMKSVFGSGAYLQWKWQRLDDDSFGILSASDSRFGDDGFTFTLSPADVDTKVTFMCELIV